MDTLYGAPTLHSGKRRVRINQLREWKDAGQPWAMLTAYDYSTARIFDSAGVPVLLVGDSAANVVYGYDTTLQVGLDEMMPLVRAVSRAATRSMVVADMPFGTYEASNELALTNAASFMREGNVHAVKLEGGEAVAPQISALVRAGIPVMAHIGFTPQSVHALGGFRVQGRGDEAAENLVRDAKAVEQAGAFAVVLEMVPAEIAGRIAALLSIPVIGCGAGSGCDAQVLVWQDMAGFTDGPKPKFAKRFGAVGDALRVCVEEYMNAIESRTFPDDDHSFQ
ncbi:3-methyl-2-oxobutanoate hydroxymethyltransferase [Nocardia sp. NPDC058519]|uniref:3-methyl-2-oxobutanoate hydroxymethyltransferase n=1 Tax=Nocardia sp. NPDC058519 TaxID=3346535 RepID=UPI0036673BC2